jgi:hypothetical protein
MKKQKEQLSKGEIIIFKDKSNKVSLEVKLEKDSVWIAQVDMAKLFQTERSVITKHLKNIFESGELNQKSNVQKMHIPFSDKPVNFYSLDAIISVGYRVNSKQATAFHQFYNECHVLVDDDNLKQARLGLLTATQIALKNTLDILGISAPDKM